MTSSSWQGNANLGEVRELLVRADLQGLSLRRLGHSGVKVVLRMHACVCGRSEGSLVSGGAWGDAWVAGSHATTFSHAAPQFNSSFGFRIQNHSKSNHPNPPNQQQPPTPAPRPNRSGVLHLTVPHLTAARLPLATKVTCNLRDSVTICGT